MEFLDFVEIFRGAERAILYLPLNIRAFVILKVGVVLSATCVPRAPSPPSLNYFILTDIGLWGFSSAFLTKLKIRN